VIEVRGLTKRYGNRAAVDRLTFDVRPGIVTGFLGPNGAGKSTTMRLILGLDAPTAGDARVNGRRYRDFPAPLTEVGALLEARASHPGRSARSHLKALAATHAIGARRVNQVLDLAGLSDVAGRRVGSFSLGMGQRLGIAAALLGDPGTVILDEPINGLDPEGVRWVRHLLKALAAEGRTVFLSSHVMSELALTVEHVIVVGQGRLIADASVAELMAGRASLEEAFMELTAGAVEYRAAIPEGSPRWPSR
jgi:ABC-2 type transport system ATP-binding protein